MADTTALPPASVLLVGAAGSGRHALADELAKGLAPDAVHVAVIERIDALPAASPPGPLVLLLAPRDAAGEADDLRWRDALDRAGLPYCVLHGHTAARLASAWNLVRATLPAPQAPEALQTAEAPLPGQRWRWHCDKCSDPACEHRLFRDLVAKRQPAAPASY